MGGNSDQDDGQNKKGQNNSNSNVNNNNNNNSNSNEFEKNTSSNVVGEFSIEKKQKALDEVIERVMITVSIAEECMRNSQFSNGLAYLNDCKKELNKYVYNIDASIDRNTDRSQQLFEIDLDDCTEKQREQIAHVFCNLAICLGLFVCLCIL